MQMWGCRSQSGAQVRNGAWQPSACPRAPERNFPIITLPNFSASVKDHLVTRRSWAPRPAARPFAQNHSQQAEKTHSPFLPFPNPPPKPPQPPTPTPSKPGEGAAPLGQPPPLLQVPGTQHPLLHYLCLCTCHQPPFPTALLPRPHLPAPCVSHWGHM